MIRTRAPRRSSASAGPSGAAAPFGIDLQVAAAMGMGSVLSERGDPAAAGYAADAIELCRAAGSAEQLAAALPTAAMVCWQVGALDLARAFVAEAHPLHAGTKRIARVVLLSVNAGLALAEGDAAAAIEIGMMADAEGTELGVEREMPLIRAVLARALLAGGNQDGAAERAAAAVAAALGMNFAFPLAVALETAALVLHAVAGAAAPDLARLAGAAASIRRRGDRPPPAPLARQFDVEQFAAQQFAAPQFAAPQFAAPQFGAPQESDADPAAVGQLALRLLAAARAPSLAVAQDFTRPSPGAGRTGSRRAARVRPRTRPRAATARRRRAAGRGRARRVIAQHHGRDAEELRHRVQRDGDRAEPGGDPEDAAERCQHAHLDQQRAAQRLPRHAGGLQGGVFIAPPPGRDVEPEHRRPGRQQHRRDGIDKEQDVRQARTLSAEDAGHGGDAPLGDNLDPGRAQLLLHCRAAPAASHTCWSACGK